jgi:hypothetical protein
MNDKTCKDCCHWHKIEGLVGGQVVHDVHKPGECRAAPPSVVQVSVGKLDCIYPQLRPSYPACALFRPRPGMEMDNIDRNLLHRWLRVLRNPQAEADVEALEIATAERLGEPNDEPQGG